MIHSKRDNFDRPGRNDVRSNQNRQAHGGHGDPIDSRSAHPSDRDSGNVRFTGGSNQNNGPRRNGNRFDQHRNTQNRFDSAAASSAGPMSGLAQGIHGNALPHIMQNPHHAAPGDLKKIAHATMEAAGMATDFPPEALTQLAGIQTIGKVDEPGVRDLRNLLWSSIDNDDSRDLDQIEYAERLPNGDVKVLVGIADVDSLVTKDTPLDKRAQQNTTSIYTAPEVFPMFPEKLSTDLTSLNPNVDRLAMVVEMVVGSDGTIKSSDVSRGVVNNHAKLAYDAVAGWLEGKGPEPAAMTAVPGIADQVKLQDEVAQKLKAIRHENGALDLQSLEARTVMKDGAVKDVQLSERNRAHDLIEDLMVAANGVTARFIEQKGYPTLRRVVKNPEKWPKIVALAAEKGGKLPAQPDSKALEAFLRTRLAQDPDHYPDLSLAVVKLLGRGEYVVQAPGADPVGHFCLAVKEYGHFTAPNRRYPDLIQGRIAKDAIAGVPCRYSNSELEALATQCTDQETKADKVERSVQKSATAILLQDKIGQRFDAMVTGASDKGTWVRIFKPPTEGRLSVGQNNLKVGDKVTVKLDSVNIERGFIDFSR